MKGLKMAKQKDFDVFLSNIEPSQSTVSYISSVQNNLRSYLEKHSMYKDVHIETFLSGSYAKHTSIRPAASDKKRDVDIIVVTKYDSSSDSSEVLQELCDVLKEKDLYSSATVQSHSVGLELTNITIDVVPVIEHEIYEDVYYVGSSENGDWKITDPKGHKEWSTEINKNNNNEFKPLVKIFKWWRRTNCPIDKKYPKGITLEKLIADNIGDATLSTEDFLIDTMQKIVDNYADNITNGEMPCVDDPSDYISDNDLLSGYDFDDFKEFVEKIENHLKKLNEEGTTNAVWRELFGTAFPAASESNYTNAVTVFQPYLSVPHRKKPMWQIRRSGAVFITAKIKDWNGNIINYENDSFSIEKHCEIVYTAKYNSCKKHKIMWQIVNTGYEAKNCLRGGFEESNVGTNSRRETTMYAGKHYVQCFVIDRYGICVARSKEFFINIK